MQESILINEVRSLYQSYSLHDCIKKVDELDQNLNFDSHQLLQLYKGLSYFELGQSKEGIDNFQQIIEEQIKAKDNKIDKIDLLVRINYFMQVYYYEEYLCQQIVIQLKEACDKFKEQYIQNQNDDDSYLKGVYLFGYGLYLILQNEKTKLDEAFQAIEDSLLLVDDFKQEILSFLGFSYYYFNKLEQSLKISLQLYQLNPQYPSIANNLALCYQKMMNYEQVEKYFQEAEKICPHNNFIMANQAAYYKEKENLEKVSEYYLKCYNTMPRQARACHVYGKFLCEDNIQDGISKFKEGIEIDPTYVPNYTELAYYFGQTDYESSKKLIIKSLELQPNNYDIYLTLANIQRQNQLIPNAIHSYYVSLQLIKNDLFAQYVIHSMLGRCFFEEAMFKKSLEHFFLSLDYPDNCYENENLDFISKMIDECEIEDQVYSLVLIEQSKQGAVQKFQKLANLVLTQNYKIFLNEKLDYLRQLLSLISYQKHIQQFLLFKNGWSHLDLCFD